MRNLFIPLTVGLMCTSFTIIPTVTPSYHTDETVVGSPFLFTDSTSAITEAPASVFLITKLHEYGLSEEAFNYAWKGFQKLSDEGQIERSNYLTICDFSQPSNQKRLYIIDVVNNKLMMNTYVAHGKNSGGEYASKFSNTPESLQSSLGFYITTTTYTGVHGMSLRLKGVDPGYNDKAFARSIVLHGAAYVDATRAAQGVLMGRSFGCPSVPQKESALIINTIKNGSCLFIYHPGKAYLQGSKILNG